MPGGVTSVSSIIAALEFTPSTWCASVLLATPAFIAWRRIGNGCRRFVEVVARTAYERSAPTPDVPLSHPLVERLIGAIRREYLDRVLFWTIADLEAKLIDFQHYSNGHRTQGRLPEPPAGVSVSLMGFGSYRWRRHCRSLYQTPIAA